MPTAEPMSHKLFQQPWPEGEYRMLQLGFVVDDLLTAARRWVEDFTEGPSVFADLRDLYDSNKTGFHQICTVTGDCDEKKAHYESLGYELACEFTSPGQRVAFFDTIEDFGFFTEVAEEKASFQVNLARISQTCAERDGNDPIRILTRDGYCTPE